MMQRFVSMQLTTCLLIHLAVMGEIIITSPRWPGMGLANGVFKQLSDGVRDGYEGLFIEK